MRPTRRTGREDGDAAELAISLLRIVLVLSFGVMSLKAKHVRMSGVHHFADHLAVAETEAEIGPVAPP